jgi:hypothetical protein
MVIFLPLCDAWIDKIRTWLLLLIACIFLIGNCIEKVFHLLEISKLIFNMWTPYIIFAVGYFLTWRKSQLDKKKDVLVYRDLFIEWIVVAKKRTLAQAENCLSFSKSLRDSVYIDAERFSSMQLMYEKLNTINTDKVINAFVLNVKSKDNKQLENFNKLISNIHFLHLIDSELKEKYDKSVQDAYVLNQMFNDSFIDLQKFFLKKVNEVGDNKDHKDYKYVKILGDFRKNWESTSEVSELGFTAVHTFDKLISPSIEFVVDCFNKDKTDTFLLDIYNELNMMVLIKRRWEVYKVGHSQIFEDYGNAIKSSYQGLEDCVKYFKEKTELLSLFSIR